ATTGQALPSGPTAQPSLLDAATASASASPRTAVVSPEARSTISVTANAPSQLPSGISVEVSFEETYNLLSDINPQLVDRPTQDFVLYAYPAATVEQPNRLGAFFIAKPTRSDLTVAQLRTANVHVVIRSGRAATTGVLLGTGGGQITTDDGTEFRVGAGALQANTPVFLHTLSSELAGVQLPTGYEIVGAVDVDLSGATLSTGGTLIVPAVAGDLSRIVVARLISTGGQRGPKVVARAVEANGKLRSTTAAPGVPAGVQLSGITSGGRYLFIRIPSAFGYATGTVTDGAGGPAAASVKVSVDKTPFVDLTGTDGRYVVITAAGAGAAGQNEIGAASVVTDATGVTVVASAAQDAVVTTALGIASTPLGVSSISPATSAADVIATTPVTLTFTKPIAAATLTGSNFRVVTDAGNPVLGTITVLAGNRVASFTPSATLAGSTRYHVLLSTSVLDIYGKPLAAAVDSTFTTASVIPVDSRLRPERIHVSYPDATGFATVMIPARSVPLGSTIVAINNTSGATVTTVAGAEDIQLRLLAHVGDEIVVLVHQPDGAEYSVAQSAYRRDDGRTSVGPNGGSVTSDDGQIVLILPKGSITGQVDLKLTPKGEDSITLPRTGEMDPSNVVFGAGVEVKAEGNYTVEKELHLETPAPASAREGQRVSVLKPAKAKDENGQEVDVWETVTSARVEGGKFKTNSPPFFGIALLSVFTIYMFMPTRMRVIFGNVTDLGTKLPVPNVVCLLDQSNSGIYGRVLGRTNQQGRYCFFDFTVSTEQSVQLKVIDEVNSRLAYGTAVSPLTIPDMFSQGLTGFVTMSADIGLPSIGGRGTANPPPYIELYGQSVPELPKAEDPINTARIVPLGTTVKIFAQTDRKIATIKGKLTIGGSIEQTLTWKLDREDATNELKPQLYETTIPVTSENSYSVSVDGYTFANVEATRSRSTFNFIGQRNPNTRPPLEGPPSVISVNPANQATNVDASSNVRIEFSEPVRNLVGGSTVYLQEEGSLNPIGGQILSGGLLVAPDTSNVSSIVFKPTGGLRGNKKYTLHVTTAVVDTTNVPLDQQPAADVPDNQEFTSTFQTFGGTVINDNPITDDGNRVVVAGDYACTLTPGPAVSRVNLYDISNPQTPTSKGFINVPQRAFAIAMIDSDDQAIKLGGTIYTRLVGVTTYNPLQMDQPANFWLISFDKPEAPQIVGVTSLFIPEDYPSSPLSLRLLNGRAYIGNTPFQGVMVVDLHACVASFLSAPYNNPIVKAVTPGAGHGWEDKVQTVRYKETRNAPSAAPSIDVINQRVTSQRDNTTPRGVMPVVYAANDIGKQMVSIGFTHGTDFQNGHVGNQELDYRIFSMANVTPVVDGPRLIRVAPQIPVNNQATDLALLTSGDRLWIFNINDPVNPVQYTSSTLSQLGINGFPRFLEIEGTLAYIIVNNEIAVVSFADPEHPRLMTTISGIGTNVTSLAIKDGFIYSVSSGTGARDGLNVSIARPASQVFVYGLTPGSDQRCGNPVILDRNSNVMRQHAGIFFQVFGRNKRPVSQQVIIRKNEETLATVPATLFDSTTERLAIGQADWQTNVQIDRTALYTAELVMDENSPDEYHSAREPIPFSYLIENYSDTIGLSMAGNSVSDEKVSYGYVIGSNANIELTAAGNALVGGEPRPFGLNVELLNPAGLQEGRYPFRLRAVMQSDTSVTDEVSGVMIVTSRGADLRPPGHTVVNGVDLGSGNLGLSHPDIPEIKNRG
ncbi:MAG TPA: Ig-like domain-containing protein, partial [Pyrinomonadaceae bacterium]